MLTRATLINLFEGPSEVPDEDFVAWWVRARDFLNDRVGVIPTALHRSIRPEAEFRFVNVAQIPDVEAWQGCSRGSGISWPRDARSTASRALRGCGRRGPGLSLIGVVRATLSRS
jgi:hypothetical protein